MDKIQSRLKFLILFGVCFLFQSSLMSQTCDCKEYLYVNDPDSDGIHKFEISADGSLQEIGNIWYPGTNVSELGAPHGFAMDSKGYVYVSESQRDTAEVRRLTCDGEISPETGPDGWAIDDVGAFNIVTIGNTIYLSTPSSTTNYSPTTLHAFDSCDGTHLGEFCVEENGSTWTYGEVYWGLYSNGSDCIYASTQRNDGYIIKYTSDMLNGQCATPLVEGIELDDDITQSPKGITVDENGYIFVVMTGWGTESQILVYDPAGNFVTKSVVDDVEGDGGFYGAVSINYSEDCQCLYTANWTYEDDCVSRFYFDAATSTLTYDGPAVGPVSAPAGDEFEAKASSIVRECCPVFSSFADTLSICQPIVDTNFSLVDFLPCESVCAGEWSVDSNTAGTYDSCDYTFTYEQEGSACFSYDYN